MPKKRISEVIPPKSKFKLIHYDETTPMWKAQVGRIFRIGYYSDQDGTDCIWLVNEMGGYEQTTSREFFLKYFEPLEISDETDFFKNPTTRFGSPM